MLFYSFLAVFGLAFSFVTLFRLSGESRVFSFAKGDPRHAIMNETQKSDAPIPKYHFGIGQGNHDQGKSIDIDSENQKVIRFIRGFISRNNRPPSVYIVPGYVPNGEKSVQLHRIARYRLNSAAKRLSENLESIIFVTGGNANPKDTPFNEAMEMKRHLMKEHGIPEFLIAIDPNAQNTVTNLRNAGRFIKAFHLDQATIVTTLIQNLYVSYGDYSGFNDRSMKMLGYLVGEISLTSIKTARFRPSSKVVQRSNSEIDP